jgi:hypothetical protein
MGNPPAHNRQAAFSHGNVEFSGVVNEFQAPRSPDPALRDHVT